MTFDALLGPVRHGTHIRFLLTETLADQIEEKHVRA